MRTFSSLRLMRFFFRNRKWNVLSSSEVEKIIVNKEISQCTNYNLHLYRLQSTLSTGLL